MEPWRREGGGAEVQAMAGAAGGWGEVATKRHGTEEVEAETARSPLLPDIDGSPAPMSRSRSKRRRRIRRGQGQAGAVEVSRERAERGVGRGRGRVRSAAARAVAAAAGAEGEAGSGPAGTPRPPPALGEQAAEASVAPPHRRHAGAAVVAQLRQE